MATRSPSAARDPAASLDDTEQLTYQRLVFTNDLSRAEMEASNARTPTRIGERRQNEAACELVDVVAVLAGEREDPHVTNLATTASAAQAPRCHHHVTYAGSGRDYRVPRWAELAHERCAVRRVTAFALCAAPLASRGDRDSSCVMGVGDGSGWSSEDSSFGPDCRVRSDADVPAGRAAAGAHIADEDHRRSPADRAAFVELLVEPHVEHRPGYRVVSAKVDLSDDQWQPARLEVDDALVQRELGVGGERSERGQQFVGECIDGRLRGDGDDRVPPVLLEARLG